MKKLQYSIIIAATAIVLSTPMASTYITAKNITQYNNIKLSQPIVADTSQYRGIVTSVYEEDGVYTFTLSQVEGTDFGMPQRNFQTTDTTKFNFDKELLKEGNYIEVFYNASNDSIIETENAILINQLLNADLSIYRGTVSSITKKNKKSGEILLTSEDKVETIFRYSKKTKCNLNIDSIKSGDDLTIYYNGILTRSIPAQGFAMEISKTSTAQTYRGIVTNIINADKQTTISLKRATGSDFSEDSLDIVFDNTTKSTIKKDEIKKDMYLEVYYEPVSSEAKSKNPIAISIEKLLEADMINYSAIIQSIEEGKDKSGIITVTDLDGKVETVFHYSPATYFKLPIEDLKKGTKVNIYNRGVFTLSIPAQGSALEITKYKK